MENNKKMNLNSTALEENIKYSQVDVDIKEKHKILQEIMKKYIGIMEGLNTFLKELSHPRKNWQFIVKEARVYSLDHFHVIRSHEKGPDGALLLAEIYFKAIEIEKIDQDIEMDAADNLLLFLQKIINDSGNKIKLFLPVIEKIIDHINNYSDQKFFIFVKSYYRLDRILSKLINNSQLNVSYSLINKLLFKYYQLTYKYFINEKDPGVFFEELTGLSRDNKIYKKLFDPVSHNELDNYIIYIEKLLDDHDINSISLSKKLLKLPGFNQISSYYLDIPNKLLEYFEDIQISNKWKMAFLFHIMSIKELVCIHEETLRDVNRTVELLIKNQNIENNELLINNTFQILKSHMNQYPEAALQCLLNIGKGVYSTDQSDLVFFCIDKIVGLGFQFPDFKGVGDDWQIRANKVHLQNIRTWLELIILKPGWSKKLLSSLIVNLSLGGVFIKDTDLFPRDITYLLNSEIEPVFNLIKQLARLFPAYFNEIGAEGKLREISTNMDEIYNRKDKLIHFVRKQSHVQSSNQTLKLTEEVLKFWHTKDKNILEIHIPPNIYSDIEPDNKYIKGMHKITDFIFKEKKKLNPKSLLELKTKDLIKILKQIPDISDDDKTKFKEFINFYKLLFQKYHLDFINIDEYLNAFSEYNLCDEFPNIEKIKQALNEPDILIKIQNLLKYLEELKALILSNKRYDIKENIYKKRHFAYDIPSMYGSYHEMKFDALALTFRIESLVNTLFDKLVETIDFKLITRSTFYRIQNYLVLFASALKIDGILSIEMQGQLELLNLALQKRGFTYTQYVDIFKGISRSVKHIVHDHFHHVHESNIRRIVDSIENNKILSKYLPKQKNNSQKPEQIKQRIFEIFYRDSISACLGLKHLDLFVTRILNTLFKQEDKLDKELFHSLLNYDAEKAITPIFNPRNIVFDPILLGMKGYNLVKLKRFGLPVPPGFIVTTEIFRSREVIDQYDPAKKHFKDEIISEIRRLESITKKKFADSKNPMLLSVRSGSSVSQPGMMDTFLNVGINEKIAEGISSQNGKGWFAWDNYRRFLQIYGMSFGIKRDEFDAIMIEFKKKYGVTFKRSFTDQQMKELALVYKQLILDNNHDLKEDPYEQLLVSINRIFDSWHSERAKAYRKIMGISDDWGTAVTVQAMIYGNINQNAGAGVIFTRSPRGGGDIISLWGDFTPGNQGEDVVGGLVKTHPITKKQANYEKRPVSAALESLFPKIYKGITEVSDYLINKMKWNHQEIEFTFESPSRKDLYILQTRDMTLLDKKTPYHFDLESEKNVKFMGHGIGIGGGAMSGRIVFSIEEMKKWKIQEPDTSLILIRNDTVPDDIQEIYEADGLLTAKGGSTSHAAVVAHRLGKTCVVGYTGLESIEDKGICLIENIKLKSGDYISIDGRKGSVYIGKLKVKQLL